MIKLDAFIRAIQAATLAANESLDKKNLEIFHRFFESTDEEEQLDDSFDEVLDAAKSVLKKREGEDLEELEAAIKQLESLRRGSRKTTGAEPRERTGGLRAKTVTVKYPRQTAEGVSSCDVKVPLITMVPLSMTQVSELKLRSELEMQVVEGELLVGFAGIKEAAGSADKKSVATLEVTLSPVESPEGMKQLIEGYEKLLRAQLPS